MTTIWEQCGIPPKKELRAQSKIEDTNMGAIGDPTLSSMMRAARTHSPVELKPVLELRAQSKIESIKDRTKIWDPTSMRRAASTHLLG